MIFYFTYVRRDKAGRQKLSYWMGTTFQLTQQGPLVDGTFDST